MSTIAVFDIGTVTCRLRIFRVANQKIVEVVHKDLEICNLGKGVDATGVLSESAIESTLLCIKRFANKVRATNVDTCVCTLTSAARDASNSKRLLDGLRKLGIQPQIIEGNLEGKLTFLGVAQDFYGQRICVMDSGGGSTELCVGALTDEGLSIDWIHSYNLGARRLTDRFFNADASGSEETIKKALENAKSIIDSNRCPMSLREMRLVGVGGTVTTISAINLGLKTYDSNLVHLSEIDLGLIRDMGSTLNALDIETRSRIPGLQKQRASVIVGGICAVQSIMEAYGVNKLTVSESDILCGLAIVADSTYKYEKNVVKCKPQLFNL